MSWKLSIAIIAAIFFADLAYSVPEYHEFKYRSPWPTRRLYPYLRDLDEFKEIVVTENTHPGFKEPLLHTDKHVYEIALDYTGSRFAAILDINKTKRMFFVDPEKTILQEFSTSYGFTDSSPLMTSNADKIFFASDRFGNEEIYLAEYEKFKVSADYTVDIQVDNLFDNTEPSIDGKGEYLAYLSRKEGRLTQIFVKHLPTGKEMVPVDLTHRAMSPILSYDGKHLTYVSFFKNDYEVFYADLKNKITINVSDHKAKDYNAKISGGGNRIIFQSSRNGLDDIYMLDRGDLTLYNLTHDQKAFDFNPFISADGQIIAFESQGKWEDRSIKVIDFNKKLIFKFHTNKESKSGPMLSADGKILLFIIDDIVYRVELEKVKDNTGTG